MNRKAYAIVNLLTFYRLSSAPLLIVLLLYKQYDAFKWLLALSFFTDAIDGFLARKFAVISSLGARVDSVADDLTILVAIIGIALQKPDFLRSEWFPASIVLLLYLIQNITALIRYHKLTSFHTYAAKIAAVSQGIFLLLFYFLPEPSCGLFYVAIALTAADLAEEILLTQVLPEWEADVKGLYWVLKRKQCK